MKLGMMCRQARIEQGISLRCAAEEMGYSPNAVSHFERGNSNSVNYDMLEWYVRNTDLDTGEWGGIFEN